MADSKLKAHLHPLPLPLVAVVKEVLPKEDTIDVEEEKEEVEEEAEVVTKVAVAVAGTKAAVAVVDTVAAAAVTVAAEEEADISLRQTAAGMIPVEEAEVVVVMETTVVVAEDTGEEEGITEDVVLPNAMSVDSTVTPAPTRVSNASFSRRKSNR